MVSIPVVLGTAVVVAALFCRRYFRKEKERRDNLVVTHCRRVRSLKGSWAPTPFLTRDAQGPIDLYYVGYQGYTLSQESVDLLVAQGEIIALHPTPIALSQRLWLTPFGELIIASKENPKHDQSAVHVGKMTTF